MEKRWEGERERQEGRDGIKNKLQYMRMARRSKVRREGEAKRRREGGGRERGRGSRRKKNRREEREGNRRKWGTENVHLNPQATPTLTNFPSSQSPFKSPSLLHFQA